MYLKLTPLKTILSLLVLIILEVYSYLLNNLGGGVCEIRCAPLHGPIGGGLPDCPPCAYPSYNDYIYLYFLSVVAAIVFYLIYSFFQKRVINKNSV